MFDIFTENEYLKMFFAASLMVQLVMLLLLGLSITVWAMIFNRYVYYARVMRQQQSFCQYFNKNKTADINQGLPATTTNPYILFYKQIFVDKDPKSLKSARDIVLSEQNEAVLQLSAENERFMPFLANVASSAPFIGLFGTVWGIMESFQAIAQQKTASLSVLAPHISEALLATGMGLFVAIPASVAYNIFASKHHNVIDRFEAFSEAVIVRFYIAN
jgi:biopolymer transport protein TolQ